MDDLPETPPPNTITVGGRIPTCEFWEDVSLHTLAGVFWKTA